VYAVDGGFKDSLVGLAVVVVVCGVIVAFCLPLGTAQKYLVATAYSPVVIARSELLLLLFFFFSFNFSFRYAEAIEIKLVYSSYRASQKYEKRSPTATLYIYIYIY
jgi:hypothetical protein